MVNLINSRRLIFPRFTYCFNGKKVNSSAKIFDEINLELSNYNLNIKQIKNVYLCPPNNYFLLESAYSLSLGGGA